MFCAVILITGQANRSNYMHARFCGDKLQVTSSMINALFGGWL